jgi:iron complex outermembrane recepter protein
MRRHQTRSSIALYAAITPLLCIAPAAAQNGASASAAIEEIVVTAQRREQSLQDVPVAVTAVDADTLAESRVDSVAGIQAISPSINFDVTNSAANSANIRIRGIGTTGNNRSFEGAVGVFVDGVYRTRAGQALQNWVDVESLQVLRGPQGTLFGKNTSAGALLISSRAPSLAHVEGSYDFTVGNYGLWLARGALNAPLGEDVAVRVAGMGSTMEGFITDPNSGEDYNDRNPRALKGQVLWQASEDLRLRLIADWSEERNNCCYGQVDAIDGPLQPYIYGVLLPERGLAPPSPDFDDYEMVLSNNTDQTIKDKGVVLHVDYGLGDGSLRSVTAQRRWNIEQLGMDADFTGANILTINESFVTDFFSQELTYNGRIDALGFADSADYVVGLYYADEEIFANYQLLWGDQAQAYFDTLLGAQGAPPGTVDASEGLWHDADFPATSESYAAFTHWDFRLGERFGLIAGLRYSRDEKRGAYERSFFSPVPNTAFRALRIQPGPEFDETFEDDAVTGTLALQYRLAERAMAYASYSRGYKSGGVNIDNTAAGGAANNPDECVEGESCVPEDPTYRSEFNDGYEIGLKSEYWDRRVRSNLAVFYNDLKDLQVALFSGTAFSVTNAADATVYGAELENSLRLTEALSLQLDLTWLAKAQYGDDPALDLSSAGQANLSGRDFAQAPELAANAALSLDQPLTPAYALTGRIAAQYSGEQYTNPSNDEKRGARTEYDVGIGLRSTRHGWSLSAWCQNCTDERYVVQHFNSPLQGTDRNAYVSAPRTYGVSLRGSF